MNNDVLIIVLVYRIFSVVVWAGEELFNVLLILLLVFSIVVLAGAVLSIVDIIRPMSVIGRNIFYMVMGIIIYSIYLGDKCFNS